MNQQPWWKWVSNRRWMCPQYRLLHLHKAQTTVHKISFHYEKEVHLWCFQILNHIITNFKENVEAINISLTLKNHFIMILFSSSSVSFVWDVTFLHVCWPKQGSQSSQGSLEDHDQRSLQLGVLAKNPGISWGKKMEFIFLSYLSIYLSIYLSVNPYMCMYVICK